MRKHSNEFDAHEWDVIDVATKKPIRKCQWADDETGEYEVYVIGKDGEVDWDEKRQKFQTLIKKGNIKLVRKVKLNFFQKIFRYLKGKYIKLCKKDISF